MVGIALHMIDPIYVFPIS